MYFLILKMQLLKLGQYFGFRKKNLVATLLLQKQQKSHFSFSTLRSPASLSVYELCYLQVGAQFLVPKQGLCDFAYIKDLKIRKCH